jgi:hypothetical protein
MRAVVKIIILFLLVLGGWFELPGTSNARAATASLEGFLRQFAYFPVAFEQSSQPEFRPGRTCLLISKGRKLVSRMRSGRTG